MRRLPTLTLRLAPAALLAAVVLSPASAKADITLFDSDGWSVYTNGLVAAHYQHIGGDADPNLNSRSAAGGKILDGINSADRRDASLANMGSSNGTLNNSDVRSGFIGTQIGFGVNRLISQSFRVESLLSININGINNNRGQEVGKGVDYREAWARIVSPYGSLKFGRMFGLFASASAEVQVLAWRWGVGHPCVFPNPGTGGISCGSTGAGPLYPGFDAAFRYTSPRIAGFEFSVAVADPNVGVGLQFSPYPRVDTDLNFDKAFGPARLRLMGQSMFNRVGTTTPPQGAAPNVIDGTLKMDNIWGAMGAGILNVGPAVVGGGGWVGAGVGERIPLEAADPANPIAFDASQTLRNFRGFFGNVGIDDFHSFGVTAGGGILYVQPTTSDKDPAGTVDVLKNQWEYHVTAHYKMDTIVLNVEYMHWQTNFHFGETQNLNFVGAGINYFW